VPDGRGYYNVLNAVDAVSPDDIWAVGDQGASGSYESRIQHWNGTSWEIVASPDPLTLQGVAAIASDDVWAVGYPDSYGQTRTIHWDGNTWSVVPSPNVEGHPNYLYDVAASGPNDVWAVGKANSRPLLMHWDGTEWSIVPPPDGVYGSLNGVDVLSPNDAWAVGTVGVYNGEDLTVVLHWDGTSWTRVNSPNPGTYRNILHAVKAIAPNDVWAVGALANGPVDYHGLLMHWDGTGWDVFPAPGDNPQSPNTYGVHLHGVDAASSNEVWAVGRDYISSDTMSVLLRWDGTSWTEVNHPRPSRSINRLFDVVAVAPGEAWAVGTYWEDTISLYRANVLRYGPGCGTPTPTVTGTPPTATSTAIVPTRTATSTYTATVPSATPTCRPDQWTIANPLPGARMGPAVAAVGGFLYEAGGDTGTQGPQGPGIGANEGGSPQVRTVASARFDGISWAPIANLPTAVMDGAGVGDDTYFYVMGGHNYTTAVTNNQRYDPASNTWTARAPLPLAAGGAASVFYNGRIYLFGGCNDNNCSVLLDAVQIYDPATNTWSTGADIPTGVSFAVAEAIGNYVYLAGGLDGLDENKAYRYDLLTNTWDDDAMADLSDSLWAAASGVLNGKMYVMGGILNNSSGASNRTIKYDPLTNTWTNAANLNVGAFRMQGDFYNNSLYVVGGSLWGSYSPRVERYTVNTGCPTPPVVATGTRTATAITTATGVTTATGTRTATAVATVTSCPGLSISGALTLNDPTQAGRLHTLFDASTCAAPRSCPGVIDIVPRHYDAYAFTNTSSSEACFTVSVQAACLNNILIHSSTYLNSFDPNNLCANYLADVGPGVLTNSQYSFTVPAGARFVVVVNELAPNLLCPNYTVTVSGPACPAPSTPAPSSTPILPTLTVTPALPTLTVTPGLPTLTVLPTVEGCSVHFNDVAAGNTFHDQIMCLSCMGFTSGYSDGTFRPNSEVTRGQLAKIVSNTAGFNDLSPANTQSFADVPIGSTFHMYIERMASRGIISGYACGGPGEPCGRDNKPYFRPGANATRGQISKIVANAAGLNDTPMSQTFEDVPSSHTFYLWIERLAMHSMMGGYNCGGANEPCGAGSRPYFRPGANATRGQTSKIVGNGFYPDCQPARR
jgi:N-acetylneuraminic acid mutarotase